MARQLDRRNRHELAIAGFFCEHLAATGVALTNCRKGDEAAGEPDVVCQLGSERHGIEVVDCWYRGDDAKTVWGLVADLEERGIRRTVASTSDFDDFLRHPSGDQLVAICQRALEGPHGARRYGFPSWLILNASQAPLHSSSEGAYFVSWLKKPATWWYTDAYLCLAQTITWGRHFFRVP